jgi:hypothetical protein
MFRRLGPTQADHMLCADTYTKDYVNSCRSKIEAQLAAYRVLAGQRGKRPGIPARPPLRLNRFSSTTSFWS